jgi:hypothetical protein
VKFVEGVRTDEVVTIDPGLHPLLNLIDYPPFPNVNWGRIVKVACLQVTFLPLPTWDRK